MFKVKQMIKKENAYSTNVNPIIDYVWRPLIHNFDHNVFVKSCRYMIADEP